MAHLYLIPVLSLIIALYILFPLAEVEGNSMLPTLVNGDIILCSRVHVLLGMFETEGIYVIKSPNGVLAVKRMNVNLLNKSFYFLGDNPNESYDSRNYGYLDKSQIFAKVIYYKQHKGDK